MRYSLFFLALTFSISTETEKSFVPSFETPLILFILYVCGESIFQYFSYYTSSAVKAHSVHASHFENISLYSQILLATLPFISYFKNKLKTWPQHLYNFILFLISFNIFVGITRSVILGLFIFYVIEFFRQKKLRSKILVVFILLLSLSLSLISNHYKQGYSDSFAQNKASSVSYRFNVWKKAVQMSLDNPMGIGTNNFMFHVLSYTDENKISDKILDLYYSPHNEILRVVTEEGFVVGALYFFILLSLILTGLYRLFILKQFEIFDVFVLCFVPEVIFQFPSENCLPNLFFALSLSEFIKNKFSRQIKIKMIHFITLIGLILANITFWVIRNEKIIPTEYAQEFCTVFQDDWLMCKRYFADYYVAGDFKNAQLLVSPIIKREPFNVFFISLDYSLGNEPQSSVLACMYYNIFNGELLIPDSDINKCVIEKDKNKMRNFFLDYAEKR